jgi:hypothetical protein
MQNRRKEVRWFEGGGGQRSVGQTILRPSRLKTNLTLVRTTIRNGRLRPFPHLIVPLEFL